MIELGAVVGKNVEALRQERNWTRQELADRLVHVGGDWSRQIVRFLETDGVRGDRFSDVVLLCAVFQVPVERLVHYDGEIILRGTAAHKDTWCILALLGKAPVDAPPEDDGLADDIGRDNHDEVRRIAKNYGLDVSELRRRTRLVYKLHDSPTVIRDFIAGLEPGATKEFARGRRSYVMREIKQELTHFFDKDDLPRPLDEAKFYSWLNTVLANDDD